MTKKQVIAFVRSELECGNCILAASLGNGGAGAGLVCSIGFTEYLESLDFAGEVDPCDDITSSIFYDPASRTYQFNGDGGAYIQIQAI